MKKLSLALLSGAVASSRRAKKLSQAQLAARAEELSALSREEKDERKVFFVGVTQLGKKDLLE